MALIKGCLMLWHIQSAEHTLSRPRYFFQYYCTILRVAVGARPQRGYAGDAAGEVQGLLADKLELQRKLGEAERKAAVLEQRCESSQGAAGSSSAECQRLQALLSKREDRVAELAAQVRHYQQHVQRHA